MNKADVKYTGRILQELQEKLFLNKIYLNLSEAALEKGDPILAKRLMKRQKEVERQGDVLGNELRAFFGEPVEK